MPHRLLRKKVPPSVPGLDNLDDLADQTVELAQEIKRAVRELRRMDTRGEAQICDDDAPKA